MERGRPRLLEGAPVLEVVDSLEEGDDALRADQPLPEETTRRVPIGRG